MLAACPWATAGGRAAAASILVDLRRQNLASRWIGWVMLGAALTPFPVLLASYRLGLDAEAVLGLDNLVKAGGAVVLGVVVEHVFLAVVAVHLLTAGVLFAFPGTYPLEIAAGGLALALLVVATRLRDASA